MMLAVLTQNQNVTDRQTYCVLYQYGGYVVWLATPWGGSRALRLLCCRPVQFTTSSQRYSSLTEHRQH